VRQYVHVSLWRCSGDCENGKLLNALSVLVSLTVQVKVGAQSRTVRTQVTREILRTC